MIGGVGNHKKVGYDFEVLVISFVGWAMEGHPLPEPFNEWVFFDKGSKKNIFLRQIFMVLCCLF